MNLTATIPHIGCLAVTYAHFKNLNSIGVDVTSYNAIELKEYWKGNREDSLKYIYNSEMAKEIYNHDFVVINGEGTIHHDKGCHLLSLAEFSIKNNKPVFLLNLTLDSLFFNFDDVLLNCSDIVTREIITYKFLLNKNIPCRLALDDFIKADFSLSTSRDLKGAVVFTDYHPDVESLTIPLLHKIHSVSEPVAFYPFVGSEYAKTWKNVVANFKTASMIICGRYHGIYAAGLASKPFVILPMNTHKALGLIQFSKIKIPICQKKSHIENVIKFTRNNNKIFEDFNHWMKETFHEDSFLKIRDFVLSNNSINNDKLCFYFEGVEVNTIERYYDSLYKNVLRESNVRLLKSSQLLKNNEYEVFLKTNSVDYIKNDGSFFNRFISLYALGRYAEAEKLLPNLNYDNKHHFKAICNFKLEFGALSEVSDSFFSNDEEYSNELFLKTIDKHEYEKAWPMLIKRTSSQKYVINGRHFLVSNNKMLNKVFILEGGVGDQIRQSKIFFKLANNKNNDFLILCDRRIHHFLKETFDNINFVDSESLDEGTFEVCPVLDFYNKVSPFSVRDKELIVNKDLKKYWLNRIENLAKGKLIIGICQGTHIKSYDRLSNRFEYPLWLDFISQYSDQAIFVNLSFDYQEDVEHVENLNINLKDDFDNTSALISSLDYIISPANTLLDLSGALGVKTIALFTGYKFRARQDVNGNDLYHSNVVWKGSYNVNDKTRALKSAFDYIFNLDK
ncbi:polysaccharide pyruvyl transferase family protein [Acinetobacter sp. Ac_5812]|uniref:polysaccharide pyruvyl transferase family protein n=1 Tax=Acinetobacter sp. Ac_5812 TaxID=1848937 RepID=UPI00148FF8A2|nr:polysaccharide pyruvyl transferase family protein [Acinetobacter sp. Ac_5812]